MRTLRAILASFALALFAPCAAAEGEALSALARLDPAASTVADAGAGVALDLGLSQPVPYRVSLLDEPPRLVVDFREVDFTGLSPDDLDRAARILTLRWGRFRPGWSRLVAELDGPYRLTSAEEVSDDGGTATIRLRLAPTDAATFAAGAATGPAADPFWALPEPASVAAPRRRQTGDRPLFVVLDPGHGGIDPGAEAGGVTEAGLMLTFARELDEVLRRAGMQTLLTRTEDVFLPLEMRMSIARAAGADVFISLHADALAEGQAEGAAIYRLSEEASDEASARLAERHDRADLLAGIDLAGQGDEIADVLMDLARLETQPRSDRLAITLAEAIAAEGLKLHPRPVQEARFSVLRAPDIPSILIEVGFMSSERDLARLTDPAWRARMQRAILAGLSGWAIADAAEAQLLRQ